MSKKQHITTIVNGDEYEYLCEPQQTLLDILRDELTLTGTKEGCGTGDCGACTVLVDGVMVCSCLVLAVETDGAKVDTIEGKFALANAQAQNHAYEKAIKAYDEVLKAQPGNVAAKTNRAIVVAALKAAEEKRRKQEDQDAAPPDEKADEMRVDPDQKGGKKIQVTPDDMTTAGAAEAWMRQVQTSPADFLKLKFAIQAASPAATGAPR